MAVISDMNAWIENMRAMKATFKFSELKDTSGQSLGLADLVIWLNDITTNNLLYIAGTSFNFLDSNCEVNMLGVSESSTALLRIYDADGVLSPGNTSSVYNTALVNGVHVVLETGVYVKDNQNNWSISLQPYGDWYTTSIESNLGMGGYQEIDVSLQDRLNLIGDMAIEFENGDVGKFAGKTASELLDSVLSNVKWGGVSLVKDTDYVINDDIDDVTNSTLFGVRTGDKVRDIINSICQASLARAYMRLDGKIYIEPYNVVHTDTVWDLEGMGDITSINGSNCMWNCVRVKYFNRKQTEYKSLGFYELDDFPNQEEGLVLNGDSNIKVEFSNSIASVDSIQVNVPLGGEDGNNTDTKLQVKKYVGWSNGVVVTLTSSTSGESIVGATMEIFGHETTGDASVTDPVKIGTGVVTNSNSVLTFNTEQILTKSTAKALAEAVAAYIGDELRRKKMNGTGYSPLIQVGDKVVLSGINNNFNGNYRVTSVDIEFGENYSCNIGLVNI